MQSKHENCHGQHVPKPAGTPQHPLTPERGRVLSIMALYGKAPPERGTFFRLQVYNGVGITQVEVYKRAGKIGHSGL